VRTLWFITHPEIVVDPAKPVPEWSLSNEGIRRMQNFCVRPDIGSIKSVYSSNETKARESAALLTDALALRVRIVHSLHENDRSSTGYLPPTEFQKLADRFFANSQDSVEGWERAFDAQTRIVSAVMGICASDDGCGDIAVVSHGAVGALLMCHLRGMPISRLHEQPGTGGGNFFLIEIPAFKLAIGWSDIAAAVGPAS
jgi:broad specificity phosphatase PhoE